ncbi:hypothetical protein Tco_0993965 [Tanacetum coccineum]
MSLRRTNGYGGKFDYQGYVYKFVMARTSQEFELKSSEILIIRIICSVVVDSGCSSILLRWATSLSLATKLIFQTMKISIEALWLLEVIQKEFNLFSVSQISDKKNNVLFTVTECLILSPSFKILDESQVVLGATRKDDVYSLDLKNSVPSGDSLGKFDGKSDEGYLLGYSTSSKAFRDSEDVTDKEEQHQMTEDEQVLHDELEKLIAQEVIAKALDDATRQAFEEEKRNITS